MWILSPTVASTGAAIVTPTVVSAGESTTVAMLGSPTVMIRIPDHKVVEVCVSDTEQQEKKEAAPNDGIDTVNGLLAVAHGLGFDGAF